MLKHLALILALTISASLHSQHIKLNTATTIDTLRLWVNYNEEISETMQDDLTKTFISAIKNFNNEKNSFVVVIDSTNKHNLIVLDFDKIKYVNAKRNITASSIDILILVGHVMLVTTYGWTLPLWPFCMPASGSYIDMNYDETTFSEKSQRTLWIHFNGFFMRKEKQERKLLIKYGKSVTKMLNRIHYQNLENKGL